MMETNGPLIGTQASLSYPFAGIPSFLRAPIEADLSRLDADVAVLGIPSDEGSPFMPGSRFGPRRIREHSLRFGSRGYWDAREERMFLDQALESGDIVDVGDVDVLPTATEVTWANITDSVGQLLDRGAMPLIIGGDHAVSAPVVKAWHEPVHVIHFDAHIDYSPFQHGFMYTNTHPFRHIRAMPHVQSLTQLGIRSLRNSREAMEDAVTDGNRVLAVEEFRDLKAAGILGALATDAPVYVSIDIDVLDMSLVPGCVSAEPSGLVYDELREMLVAIAEHTNVVGFDLVEVNPLLDVGTGVTSYLAAHTIIEFLGHICAQPRWTQRRAERAERRRNAEGAR